MRRTGHMSFLETQDRSLLVVDDDAVFARVLARAMKQRTFDVTEVRSAKDAIAALEARPPAFALFDLRLPDGNGLDLVERLRTLRPDARSVVLTGYGDISTAVSATKLGAIDYLAKPADADAIAAALRGEARKFVRSSDQSRPEEQELRYLLAIFEAQDRNMSRTARLISKHRRSLQRILRRYGIKEGQRPPDEETTQSGRLRRLYRFWRALLEGEIRYDENAIVFERKPVTEEPRDRRSRQRRLEQAAAEAGSTENV